MSLLTLERRGAVAVLTLSRPESLNALGAPGDGAEFAEVCGAINRDRDVRCVVLTGAGRAFSAGGDIKAMRAREGSFSGSGVEIREAYRSNVHAIVRAVWGLEAPAIAAVNGPAVGLGCDLTCMTDIRLASEAASFAVTFLNIGLVPGDGGAWLLPRVVGLSRASELLFTGERIDAATARDWGLVSRVLPADELMAEALSLAERIARQPPHALRMTKALLRQGQSASFEAVLEMSAAAQAVAHLTQDHMEGLDAVLEKRAPQFRGA